MSSRACGVNKRKGPEIVKYNGGRERDVYCGCAIRHSGRCGAIDWLWLSAKHFSMSRRNHENLTVSWHRHRLKHDMTGSKDGSHCHPELWVRVSRGTVVIKSKEDTFNLKLKKRNESCRGLVWMMLTGRDGLNQVHSSNQTGRLLRFIQKKFVLTHRSMSTSRLKGGVHVTKVTGIRPT
jgi:hypothetical protein